MKKNSMHQIQVAYPGGNALGEGPLWLESSQSLCWVDIVNHKAFEYWPETGKVRQWEMPAYPSLLIETSAPEYLLVAHQKGISKWNRETHVFSDLAGVPYEGEDFRFNDGGVSPSGKLWAGILKMDFAPGSGAVYSLSKGEWTKRIYPTTIANGMQWSKEKDKLYFIDSPTNQVQEFGYERENAGLSGNRTAVSIPQHLGNPDGFCMDEDGNLWIAQYGGAAVTCWNPQTGILLDKIELPVPNITSCAFGGKDFTTLFITTANQEMHAQELLDFPLSGHLFSVELKVRGLRKPRYDLRLEQELKGGFA